MQRKQHSSADSSASEVDDEVTQEQLDQLRKSVAERMGGEDWMKDYVVIDGPAW